MNRFHVSAVLLSAVFVSGPLHAQRVETTAPAVLAVGSKCALTPSSEIDKQRESTKEFFGAALGGILAAVAGDLVKTGVTAVGTALEDASREQGFVFEGAATYHGGQIDITQAQGAPSNPVPAKASYNPGLRCLHLFVPGAGQINTIFSDPNWVEAGGKFDWLGDDAAAIDKQKEARASLLNMGVSGPPLFYSEIVLIPTKEGFVARPMLVWYRSQLAGVRTKGPSAAEMHLLFATPSFDAAKPGIGTGFAGARLNLPKLAPGQLVLWDQLRGAASVMLPPRPTTGHIDTSVQAFNASVAAVGTAKAELKKAQSAHRAAKRLVASDPKPAAKEAEILAAEAEAQGELALQMAQQAISDPQSVRAGATNVQARFVIIRDENKFGMALAKALKGQAEAVGKAATEVLAPSPDWLPADTAYLTALNDVEAKQRAYDAASAAGEAAAILSAGHALQLAKAKTNEAAVASKKAIPYPGLLN